MRYLFISGAPRSGTSILTELISSHSRISIGMERYKFLYKKGLVEKRLFKPEFFFSFKDEQTNINSTSGKYTRYYHQLEKNYDKSIIVGDKYPQLYKSWDSLFNNFGNDVKFIFIIRKIEDVASSFNARAYNPNDKWPVQNNFKKAVEIWNESLEIAQSALLKGLDIHVVSYEQLFDLEFNLSNDCLLSMFEYLEIKPTQRVISTHKKYVDNYMKSIKLKNKLVKEGQKEFIALNSNFSLYNQLVGSNS